jgi:hypothetical protein
VAKERAPLSQNLGQKALEVTIGVQLCVRLATWGSTGSAEILGTVEECDRR